MSIVIRHGSNGAMKSASAVDLYMIPAIKEGRTVVTNIRGFTLERCYDHFPDLPETLDVINVDTSTTDGKQRMANWFHWVPKGALLVFDEASSLFPKAWREKELKALSYPGGDDAAAEAGRPPDWMSAWEMHRHYNWDIVLTTPNIKGIRDDIRGTTEMAYRHRNLGKLSEKFRVIKEVQHDAQKNGFSVSDAISVGTLRISKDAFKLYDSTDTGLHQGSKAGKSLLANPRVLLLVSILLAVLAFIFRDGSPEILEPTDPAGAQSHPDGHPGHTQNGQAPDHVPADPNPASVRADGSGALLHYQRPEDYPLNDPFQGYRLAIVGSINGTTQIEASQDGDVVFLTPEKLGQLGYTYFPIGNCFGKLIYGNRTRLLSCSSNDKRRLQADGRSLGGSSGDTKETPTEPARGA
ncbi:zonular occludens toxin domain-containing protein [Marinobacter mangrovi]|uniref:zonular occludens toxin domain-containing protein n=1 Tax=Marinobacter mangrovi TaxID=2803918 RepID=UPI00193283BF|nr:zonular occludens toxin domain-containing protein [Marinobacter mangrovi]